MVRSDVASSAHTVTLSPYERATPIVDRLGTGSPRLRLAVAEAHGKLTVAERTALMTAWVAVDTASTLGVLWRDQISTTPSTDTTQAASQLDASLAKLLGAADRKATRANAVAVFNDARDLAKTFKLTASGTTSMKLPQVNATSCKATAAAIRADLGAIATSELLVASTRPGYPWVAIPAADSLDHVDVKRFVRPKWVRPTASPLDTPTTMHDVLTKRFGGNTTRARPFVEGFDKAVNAGFSPRSALYLAESGASDTTFALVRAGVKKQVAASTAAPAGATDEFAQIGALLDGLTNGARARSTALAAGKNPGIVRNVSATWNDADKTLPQKERELIACLQLPAADVDRGEMFTSLAMIGAYTASAPGDPCPAGQADCGPGQTCNSGVCVAWCGGCSIGETCSDTLCAVKDKACQGPSDCGGPNWACNGGLCVQKCGSSTCGSTEFCACAPGESLINGECSILTNACGSGLPACPVGQTCPGGQTSCQSSCGGPGGSCPNNQICQAGACQPRPETCKPQSACTMCTGNQFCDGGQTPACKSGPAEKTCSSDADCEPPPDLPSQANPRCVNVVDDAGNRQKMCVGIGWACKTADDCGPGNECDSAIGQCVDRETYTCNNSNKCRTAEKCLAQDQGPARCEASLAGPDVNCERTDKNGQLLVGECRKGRWQLDSTSAWQCVTKSPAAEVCDNLDNDCNGVPDDITAQQCNAPGAKGQCAVGTKTCQNGSDICVAASPSPEVCDGKDNDCSGTPDDNIAAVRCDDAPGTGECVHGWKTCGACAPSPSSGEVCDGKDNNCDGSADNLGTVHQATQYDWGWHIDGGLFGFSDNFLVGTKECGGTRADHLTDRQGGNNSWCESVGWANDICNEDRNKKIGNSNVTNACNAFFADPPDNGGGDCRHIVHIGISALGWIECTASHVTTVPDTCK